MAKKVELEEKKAKSKKKVENQKKVNDVKTSVKKKNTDQSKVSKVNDNNVNVLENSDNFKANVVAKDNSKKKAIIKKVIYSLIAVLIIGAFIYSLVESSGNDKYFNTISFNEVENIINDDELSIIYWASPSCGYCVKFTPVVKEVAIENGITFNYLNTANLTGEQYSTMLSYFSAFNEQYATNGLGTPSVILVKDGKVVDISVGALPKAELINYLTNNGFIK